MQYEKKKAEERKRNCWRVGAISNRVSKQGLTQDLTCEQSGEEGEHVIRAAIQEKPSGKARTRFGSTLGLLNIHSLISVPCKMCVVVLCASF